MHKIKVFLRCDRFLKIHLIEQDTSSQKPSFPTEVQICQVGLELGPMIGYETKLECSRCTNSLFHSTSCLSEYRRNYQRCESRGENEACWWCLSAWTKLIISGRGGGNLESCISSPVSTNGRIWVLKIRFSQDLREVFVTKMLTFFK